MIFQCPFVLASSSPRRQHLLRQLGISFEVFVPNVDERFDPEWTPQDIVEQLARRKAAVTAERFSQALILAADTIVVRDGHVMNKPADAEEAAAMLRSLSGRTHTVYTGIAMTHRSTGRSVTTHEATRVTFGTLNEREIDAYVRTGSPMDKAGAYGIQDDCGALFVARIEGDYYNVVGLPLHRFYRTTCDAFADLLTY